MEAANFWKQKTYRIYSSSKSKGEESCLSEGIWKNQRGLDKVLAKEIKTNTRKLIVYTGGNKNFM